MRDLIRRMVRALEIGEDGDQIFYETHTEVMETSNRILRQSLESLGTTEALRIP